MGNIMVVQTTTKSKKAIDYVQIPTKIPKEIIENDSLLILEKSLHKLEDRVMITGKTVLGINNELKTQINEIDRIEKAIMSMHEFITSQQVHIENLENQVQHLYKSKGLEFETENLEKPGFWARIFSK
jgi:uncharacterized coiled-coil protein SlyX